MIRVKLELFSKDVWKSSDLFGCFFQILLWHKFEEPFLVFFWDEKPFFVGLNIYCLHLNAPLETHRDTLWELSSFNLEPILIERKTRFIGG